MYNVFIYLLLGILIITSVLMVLIVLMQRPKNEGLGASFGGGMTQDLFGAQTTNVLQKFTVYLGAVFFGSCLLLTILYSKSSTQQSDIQKKLAAASLVKKATPSPSPATAPATLASPAPTPEALPTASPASSPEALAPSTPAETVAPEPAVSPVTP